jgi:pimeloyl-ACP methyl ester carboxylesterase
MRWIERAVIAALARLLPPRRRLGLLGHSCHDLVLAPPAPSRTAGPASTPGPVSLPSQQACVAWFCAWPPTTPTKGYRRIHTVCEFDRGGELAGLAPDRVNASPGRERRVPRPAIPNSRLEIVDAGHFVQEEPPQRYASIVIEAITTDQPS